jgi:hypothetical protein
VEIFIQICNSAFEIKWNTQKKFKVTAAFTNAYPDTNTDVITPRSFGEFAMLD